MFNLTLNNIPLFRMNDIDDYNCNEKTNNKLDIKSVDLSGLISSIDFPLN